jgi:hypothetical protein
MSESIETVSEIYQNIPFYGVQKFTQIGMFGMKIYHLATLFWPQKK